MNHDKRARLLAERFAGDDEQTEEPDTLRRIRCEVAATSARVARVAARSKGNGSPFVAPEPEPVELSGGLAPDEQLRDRDRDLNPAKRAMPLGLARLTPWERAGQGDL